MSDQQHAPMSRPKAVKAGEEEAGRELRLGEFDDVETLTLSEASLVLNALINKRRRERKDRNETEVLNRTLDHLDHFAHYREKEKVEAVERILSQYGQLDKFERAQLGSLCCSSAEEAWTLIPSLKDKYPDPVLQELLDELGKLQSN